MFHRLKTCFSLTVIVAPPSSNRRTTVVSIDGTYPSNSFDPAVISTPARAMLSLRPTSYPESGPESAPSTRYLRTTAMSGSSSGPGL